MFKQIGRVAAVVLTAAAVVVAGAPARAANPEPKAASASTVEYATYPLKKASVGHGQLSDNSVDWLKFGAQARAEIRSLQAKAVAAEKRAAAAEAKAQQALDQAADRKAKTLFTNAEPKLIANIGGKFADRHTEVGTFTMKPGTYMASLQAKFNRTVAAGTDDPEVQPQLQLVCAGQYATIMGTSISPSLDADLTGSAVNLISVDADTLCTVNAFGYNSKRTDVGSGQITVQAQVIAAKQ